MSKTPQRLTRPDTSSWDTFDIRPLLPAGSGLCLDLGCGPGARRDLEAMGYRYVGLDVYPAEAASVLAVAEHLPFADNSFDLVVAASSFEHFPDPWQAAREVTRVLKPGGCLVASLSFLEPYHARSHFHMSHLGVEKLFGDSGLVIDDIQPLEWNGAEAMAQAIYQLRLVRWLVALIVRPSLWLRRQVIKLVIWKTPSGPRRDRAREFLYEERFRFSAGIKFRACKPG